MTPWFGVIAPDIKMKTKIQYFDGRPHWRLADERVRNVLRILIDGWDPLATGAERVA